MPVPENADEDASNNKVGWILIGAAIFSFIVGGIFFLTLGQQRSGDPIVFDAAQR